LKITLEQGTAVAQKLRIVGNDHTTNGEKPQLGEKPSSHPVSLSAEQAAIRLFDLLPPLDVGDPDAFQEGVVAIFAEYPESVRRSATDAAKGIPSRYDRPTLKQIRSVCDAHYAPLMREQRARSLGTSIDPPRRQLTQEEKARRDEQVAAWCRESGKSEDELMRRGRKFQPVAPDLKGSLMQHLEGLRADLEARRARNAANERPHDGDGNSES
jgi:hypothetical protein